MDKDRRRIFEDRLREQREMLVEMRREIERSWENLRVSEIELEETATNKHLAANLDQLDDQYKQKIDAIDYALGRIQSDIYDICVNCGEFISEKRLEAVPWTTTCIDCASAANNRKV